MHKLLTKRVFTTFFIFVCFLSLVACGNKTENSLDEMQSGSQNNGNLTVIGFSQLGAESDWRSENTLSMKETFTEEKGYKLIFEDGQQKQSNQMMAIRKFIQQEVDYIVLAPVTETGWDNVLIEAKEAGIPVIIVDRMVNVSDDSLYTCWVGSNFELEGLKVCEWLRQYCDKKRINQNKLRIVDLQGNLESSAQIGRTAGLEKSARENGWTVLEKVPAEFTQTKGREVMRTLLKKYDDINVVYCENDNEALGAIEALEEAGKKIGSNINKGEVMIVSFDGINSEARKCVTQDTISCIAECNPLHGPRVEAIIKLIEDGKTPPKHSYVSEDIYVHDLTVDAIRIKSIEYKTTELKE